MGGSEGRRGRPPTMAMPRPRGDGPGDEGWAHSDASPRGRSGPPAAALPSQGPPAGTIDALRARLDVLGVSESAYRIGAPADRAWTMDQTAEGWRVGWYDREFVAPAIFEDVADAAAFLLGKIMLDAQPARADELTVRSDPVAQVPDVAPPVPESGPEPPARHTLEPEPTMIAPPVAEPDVPSLPVAPRGRSGLHDMRRTREPEPTMAGHSLFDPAAARRAQEGEPTMVAPMAEVRRAREPEPSPPPRRAREAEASPAQRWPVQPLKGEPPLTLFRGKRMLELVPGTEIDRFGNPDGNLTYAVGTSFTERSLVPDWIERPYHVYRVERPLQALSGTAIPWFEQVGGGTAYVLPESIEDLVAKGVLTELPGRKPPTG